MSEAASSVLGLQDGAVRSVHDELGGVIYRQYCGRALQNGALGDQERMFLGQIKSTLDMEQETCDKLVRDCELGRVRTMVDVMFERGQVLAPDVRKMRDMADTLDVNGTADFHTDSCLSFEDFGLDLPSQALAPTLVTIQ